MFSELENLYLSWVNDFLTVSRFAEYYGMSRERAERVIEVGRKAHQRQYYISKGWGYVSLV